MLELLPIYLFLAVLIFGFALGIRRYILSLECPNWPIAKATIISSKVNIFVNPSAVNGYIADKRYKKGATIDVFYNPRNPSCAVIETDINRTHFIAVLSMFLIFISVLVFILW